MDFFSTSSTKASKGDIIARHYIKDYPLSFTRRERRWERLYRDASKQVAHIGACRIQDRDDPKTDQRKWAATKDVRPLVCCVLHFMRKRDVQDCYARASFKRIKPISIKDFQARVRRFRTSSRRRPSDGTTSGEAAQVYSSR